MKLRLQISAWAVAVLAVALVFSMASSAWAQQRGGTLVMVVAGNPPGFDGHQESTFAMVHPTAPQYSLLIKADPTDPAGEHDIGELSGFDEVGGCGPGQERLCGQVGPRAGEQQQEPHRERIDADVLDDSHGRLDDQPLVERSIEVTARKPLADSGELQGAVGVEVL